VEDKVLVVPTAGSEVQVSPAGKGRVPSEARKEAWSSILASGALLSALSIAGTLK